MKNKINIILFILIVFIAFQLISFSEEGTRYPALVHSSLFPSDISNFSNIHNDLIKNMLKELDRYEEHKSTLISKEREEFILMKSKQKKNKNFKKKIENQIKLLEIENIKAYYRQCEIEQLKKEIVLMNLDMKTDLNENLKILREIATDNITIDSEMLGDAPDYQYLVWVGFNQFQNSDTILYLGITYCLLGSFEKAHKYLDIYIRTSIDENQYAVNDFLFYLDAYYYKAFSCYNIYKPLLSKESMSEGDILWSNIYIKESKVALDKIKDILEIPNEEDKIDEVIIKRKKILNRIWSLKEDYLKLKKEVEKISYIDD